MRKVAVPFYALVFLTEVIWMAIVPLAPTFAERLALSKVETGAVLAAAAVATLIVSLPIGVLADRIGTWPIVVASAALAVASCVGQGLAGGFWSLVAARALFGVALGAFWTAGPAWISDSKPRGRSVAALGLPITVAGVGILVGPAFSGLVADRFGIRAPFLALAAVTAVATVALLLARTGDHEKHGHQPLAETLHEARRDRVVLGSVVVMILVGLTSGGVNLLVPLALRGHGFSAGTTGLVFSASSGVFVVFSLLFTRLGPRAVSLQAAGSAAIAYGATMLVPVASVSVAAVVTFVLLRAPFWAAISTLSYPLGAVGARRARVGSGAVMGLLNLVWGASGALGPLAAAVLAQAVDQRFAFGVLVAVCLAAAAWLLPAAAADRREGAAARPVSSGESP